MPRLSVPEWICVHIKLPGTADGGEASLCVVAGVSVSENRTKNEWRRDKAMEGDEKKEGESRSREVLCLWKRGKHGDKGQRQEAGLIALGTQGHLIDCPRQSAQWRAAIQC